MKLASFLYEMFCELNEPYADFKYEWSDYDVFQFLIDMGALDSEPSSRSDFNKIPHFFSKAIQQSRS